MSTNALISLIRGSQFISIDERTLIVRGQYHQRETGTVRARVAPFSWINANMILLTFAGAIFTHDQKDSSTELAFKYAVYKINKDKIILPKTTLEYDIQYVPRDDSFHASKKGKSFTFRCYISCDYFIARWAVLSSSPPIVRDQQKRAIWTKTCDAENSFPLGVMKRCLITYIRLRNSARVNGKERPH